MTRIIELYLNKKHKKISKLETAPIIMRWLQSPRMEPSLFIIDKHVQYLLDNNGGKKVEQWLLTDDKNFNAITAERYIVSHLCRRNPNVVDNLRSDGIDACLDLGGFSVGIEVTTLNGFLGDWILVERLMQLLDEYDFLNNKGLCLTYSHKRVWYETQGNTVYQYVKQASNAIMSYDNRALTALDLSVEIQYDFQGEINFRLDKSDNFPWFQYITEGLSSKLQERSKVKQLKKYSQNLVFVGVNHSSPENWAFPRIFGDIGNNEQHYPSGIQEVRKYWQSNMVSLTNVIGICYFFYSLPSEVPFYPLRIFWRSEADRISINL